MTALNFAILVAYTLGLSIGQCMFKLAADQARTAVDQTFWPALMTSAYFYVSIALYAVLTLVWVWILSRVPLSRAYPFVALAFIFTPALSIVLFQESINYWYALGLALILMGIGLIVMKAN
jgi:drug/metabolite transporter (DMT)-like permease